MTDRLKQDVDPLTGLGVVTIGLGLVAAIYLLSKSNEATLFSSMGISEQGLTGGEIAFSVGVFYYHLVLGSICIGVASLKGQVQAGPLVPGQVGASSGQRTQAGDRWKAEAALRQGTAEQPAEFSLNGEQYARLPAEQGEDQAFCIGCRKTAPKADLVKNTASSTYYHPACLIAAGGAENS